MNIWTVVRRQSEYFVEVRRCPWWAHTVSWVVEAIDDRSGHLLCGAGLPEWVWRIPLGSQAQGCDPDSAACGNLPERSVATVLGSFFGWAIFLEDTQGVVLHRAALTGDEARRLGWHLDAD